MVILWNREFDNVILEIASDDKGDMKSITQRTEDIVEPFNERSIYSIGKSWKSCAIFELSTKHAWF